MKNIQWFSDSHVDGVNEVALISLVKQYPVFSYKINGDSVRVSVEIDGFQGVRKIVRCGDDLYYLDSMEGHCFHYDLQSGGVITELFGEKKNNYPGLVAQKKIGIFN